MRFIEESGGKEKTFDFGEFPLELRMREWFARVLTRRTGARSAVKRVATAAGYYFVLRLFAVSLSESAVPPRSPDELTAEHLVAFQAARSDLKALVTYIENLRSLLRDDPEISPQFRTALIRTQVPGGPAGDFAKDGAYADADLQQILTAVRRDIRVARDRVRAGRLLLDRYRSGDLVDPKESRIAVLLDIFDQTGDLPRLRSGRIETRVTRAGGGTRLAERLCLSAHEVTAFALLLTALTGQNFGTVAAWPAVSYRPDGNGTGPGVALVEAVKPRRGPEREHMVIALEDLPAGLSEVLSDSTGDDRLFRSPLRVYQLLVELTELSRRHGGHRNACGAYLMTPGPRDTKRWIDTVRPHHLHRWARSRGFNSSGAPTVEVRRLRQTVIEHTRRPIAQTSTTMNDDYLMPSRAVQRDSKQVITAALDDEVAKARSRQAIPVLTTAFLQRAERNPAVAATEAGLDEDALKRLVNGEQDTVLASCTDHLSGPHTEPGTPCSASFFACLSCVNARALPHQLPVQITAADRIAALRPHVDPRTWRVRYEPLLQQLDDVIAAYPAAERDNARAAATDTHRQLVDNLLNGALDLR
jgi:hypothetical protein